MITKSRPKLRPIKNRIAIDRTKRRVRMMEETMDNNQITDGKKAAEALRSLRDGFMEARGISKNFTRVKDGLMVRKIEK